MAPWSGELDRNDWGTPDYILDAVRAALGGTIDLDPASSAWHNERVGAGRWYGTMADGRFRDGLKGSWESQRLFLNPPYSRESIGPFVDRFIKEAGRIDLDCDFVESAEHGFTHGIILVNSATSAGWFQKLEARHAAKCTLAKRIPFVHPVLKSTSPRYSQSVFYFGSRPDRFREAFAGLGVVR